MTGELRRYRKLRNPEAGFARSGYTDVLRVVTSLELVADLADEGPNHFSIWMTAPTGRALVLTDFWDPLPLTRAEQVGWTLSLVEGPVLAQCERPTAVAAKQLITPALHDLRQQHSAA